MTCQSLFYLLPKSLNYQSIVPIIWEPIQESTKREQAVFAFKKLVQIVAPKSLFIF